MRFAPQLHRSRRGWLLLALSLIWCPSLSAAERVAFDYRIDADTRLGIADVADSGGWTHGDGAPTFGFRSDAVWLRTDVPPSAEVMVIDNGWLDDIEVFFIADDRDMVRYHTGNRFPFASRAIGAPPFAFPVPTGSEHVYVRSIGHSAHYLPISFTTHPQFDSAATSRALLQGCYYGIVVAMIMYYAVLFGGMRDKVYFYYVLYATSLMLMMLSKDGLGAQHVWGDSPTIQRVASDLMTTLTIAFATLFAMAFLRLRRALPYIHRALQIFVAVVLINGAVGTVFVRPVFPMINALLVVTGTLLLTGVAVLRLRQGFKPAAIYLVAAGSLLVGSSLFVSMLLGWIDDSLLARFGVQLGSTAELILLAFALSQRMNEEYRKRMWMQHRSLELTRSARPQDRNADRRGTPAAATLAAAGAEAAHHRRNDRRVRARLQQHSRQRARLCRARKGTRREARRPSAGGLHRRDRARGSTRLGSGETATDLQSRRERRTARVQSERHGHRDGTVSARNASGHGADRDRAARTTTIRVRRSGAHPADAGEPQPECLRSHGGTRRHHHLAAASNQP
jgi:hypothetical protein